MSTLEISKELYRNHQTILKAFENITKLRTWSKGKGFKNLFPQDESKLKRAIAKQPLLTRTQIFEKAEIEGVKKEKRCKILWELGSVKKNLVNLLLLKQIF